MDRNHKLKALSDLWNRTSQTGSSCRREAEEMACHPPPAESLTPYYSYIQNPQIHSKSREKWMLIIHRELLQNDQGKSQGDEPWDLPPVQLSPGRLPLASTGTKAILKADSHPQLHRWDCSTAQVCSWETVLHNAPYCFELKQGSWDLGACSPLDQMWTES